jgi:bacterioferritin (cytochrome b1)
MIKETIRKIREEYNQESLNFIIERFNKFIFDELSAAVGYNFIAERLSGKDANKVIEELKEHGKEEFEHFTELLHYAYLHGFGNKLNIKELDQKVIDFIPSNVTNCVKFIQELELEARNDYRDMVKFAKENNDIEMEEFFKELMQDEQEHYDDLAYILNNTISLGE